MFRFKKAVDQTLEEWEFPLKRPTSLFTSAKFLVIDCSAMVYLDSVGVTTLKEVCQRIEDRKIIVYMAGTTGIFFNLQEKILFQKKSAGFWDRLIFIK